MTSSNELLQCHPLEDLDLDILLVTVKHRSGHSYTLTYNVVRIPKAAVRAKRRRLSTVNWLCHSQDYATYLKRVQVSFVIA
jgi:hypothetical protein